MKTNIKRKPIIFVAVLLMIAIIAMSAYTFAKYTTSTNVDSQSATVAKWGFTVSADATNLFASDYSVADEATLATKVEDGVAVDAADVVVAPGTTGSMSFSINGNSEVRAQLNVTATGTDVSLTKGEQTYNPVKWTLAKDNTAVSGCENVTLDTIVTYLNAMDETIEAGANYSKAGSYTLTWTWAFTGADSGITGLSVDAADTILGQAAAGQTIDTAYTAVTSISNFSLSISVDQIQ